MSKGRIVFTLIVLASAVIGITWQVNHYLTALNEYNDTKALVDEKLTSAEQHFSDAKNSFDTATDAFNSVK